MSGRLDAIVDITDLRTPQAVYDELNASGRPVAWKHGPMASHVEADICRALDVYLYDTPDEIAIKAWILTHFTGAYPIEVAEGHSEFVTSMMNAVRYGGLPVLDAAKQLSARATPKP